MKKSNLAKITAALKKLPKPGKRDLAAVAVGVVLGVSGMAVQTEPPTTSVQNVAPIEVGEGELASPRMYGPLLPLGTDLDQDGIANTKDSCPWNPGLFDSKRGPGCP